MVLTRPPDGYVTSWDGFEVAQVRAFLPSDRTGIDAIITAMDFPKLLLCQTYLVTLRHLFLHSQTVWRHVNPLCATYLEAVIPAVWFTREVNT